MNISNYLTVPYGGYFKYAYTTTSLSNGGGGTNYRREIQSRAMSADATIGSEQVYTLSHPSDTSSSTMHVDTAILDPVGNQKVWHFIQTGGWSNGLSDQMKVYDGTSTVLRTTNSTWDSDATTNANPRTSATTTILEDGTTQSKADQGVDSNGNVLWAREYDLGSGAAGAVLRSSVTTYSTAFSSQSILNRPTLTVVCAGDHTTSCSTPISSTAVTYDGGTLTDVPGITQHNATYYTGFTARGNPTTVNANGIVATMNYDIGGNLLQTKDGAGNVVANSNYQTTGQVQSVTSGGATTSVVFNTDLTTNSVTGSNSDSTGWSYSAFLPTTTTAADGGVTTYSRSGLLPYVTKVTSPMGKITASYLDGFGRPIRTTVSAGTSVYISSTTTYSACSCSTTGKAVSVSRPFYSDVDGNPRNSTGGTSAPAPDSATLMTMTTSDGLGRTKYVDLPDGKRITYAYAVSSDSFGGTTTYGTTTTITEPGPVSTPGKPKRYFYDGRGGLRRVDELCLVVAGTSTPCSWSVSNLAETARYTYDLMGRLTLVQMGWISGTTFKQCRTFTYDNAGELLTSVTPEKGTVTYTYSNGLLQTKTEPSGPKSAPTTKTLTYYHDSNRRQTLTMSGGAIVTNIMYDSFTSGVPGVGGAGRLAATWNDGYYWVYGYDIMGRVTKQVMFTPYLSSGSPLMAKAVYTYDSDGRPTSVAYPSNMSNDYSSLTTAAPYAYTYDLAGRPTGLTQTVSGTANTIVDAVKYNAASQLTDWQENSASAIHREYDPARGWLTKITAPGTTGALNLNYSHSNNGQVTAITDPTVNPGQAVSAYVYDNLNRLSSATTPNWTMTYAYDDFGNRTSQSGTGSASTKGQTLTFDTTNYTNQLITTGYVFDAAGNMTNMPDGTTIAYDALNRAATIANGSTTRAMKYDANGRRIAKVNASSNTAAIYFSDPGGRLLTTLQVDTSVPGLSYSTYNGVHFAGQRVGEWTDVVGSKRSNGSTASHFYPFGEEITSTSNDAYKFAQTYRDADSGLDYAFHRYYASGIGRFSTPDPLGRRSARPGSPQSWNAYSYASNDPVDRSDPSGLIDSGGCGTSDGLNQCNTTDGSGAFSSPGCMLDGLATDCSTVKNLQLGGAAMTPTQWSNLYFQWYDQDQLAALNQAAANAKTTQQLQDVFRAFLSSFQLTSDQIDKAVTNLAGGTDLVGGHFNLTMTSEQLKAIVGSDETQLIMKFAQFHSGLPGDNGTRYDLGDGLTFHLTMGSGSVTMHFDLFNPWNADLIGVMGHIIVDLLTGHIPGMCLDPACQ